jgi:3-phenylpropionate/trans-cinnamate dioxygenase ferredoxin subunit
VSEYVRACTVDDAPEEGVLAMVIDDTPVAIVRSGGQVDAIEDACWYENVAHSEGEVESDTIECWLHGSRSS